MITLIYYDTKHFKTHGAFISPANSRWKSRNRDRFRARIGSHTEKLPIRIPIDQSSRIQTVRASV